MTTPMTGPFTRNWVVKGSPNRYGFKPDWVNGSRTWRRQVPPFNLPLEFSYSCIAITGFGGGDGADYVSTSTPPVFAYTASRSDRLYASVYERFVKKVKEDTAELATALAERQKSIDMITERATKLWMGFRAARRGDIRTLKRLWGRGAGVRANLKRQGSNVLEYSFGWAPLVGDIVSACAVLGKGIPPPYVKATQKVAYTNNTGWRDLGAVQRRETCTGFIQWSLRAYIRITDPDALLVNELGLANPMSVAWELTPWSFVVDYFVNVSTYLGSVTDFVGLELDRSNKTFFAKETGLGTGKWDTVTPPSYNPYSYTWERVQVQRTLTIPGPSLAFRLPWRMTVQRASTSIALLLQQLRK